MDRRDFRMVFLLCSHVGLRFAHLYLCLFIYTGCQCSEPRGHVFLAWLPIYVISRNTQHPRE